ncbi:MAG: trigger factor, partial [Mariprofundaceae bacterium]|nr:trigger factor [Mariprofundaceae bacterium]
MIKTEVKQLSDNEHRIDVTLPKDEYTRLYKENLNTLLAKNIQLPGFRRGKVPHALIEKKFSENLHQDTVSALLLAHYAPALKQSGLIPAVQPQIEWSKTQEKDVVVFQLLVTTWPAVVLKPLADLAVEHWDVTVNDADVDGVIDRLMQSQFRYQPAEKAVEEGDKVCMDYTGYIGDEPFDG